jgi:hypothetical protein
MLQKLNIEICASILSLCYQIINMDQATLSDSSKFSKKELSHLIEAKIASGITEISNDDKPSKQLKKAIKKAGKLIGAELRKSLKEKIKTTGPTSAGKTIEKTEVAPKTNKKASVAKKTNKKAQASKKPAKKTPVTKKIKGQAVIAPEKGPAENADL